MSVLLPYIAPPQNLRALAASYFCHGNPAATGGVESRAKSQISTGSQKFNIGFCALSSERGRA